MATPVEDVEARPSSVPPGPAAVSGPGFMLPAMLILVLLPAQDLSLNLSPSQIWATLHGSEGGGNIHLSLSCHILDGRGSSGRGGLCWVWLCSHENSHGALLSCCELGQHSPTVLVPACYNMQMKPLRSGIWLVEISL